MVLVHAILNSAVWRVALVCLVILSAPAARLKAADADAPDAAGSLARRVLQATGVEGGLIVHLGRSDARLAAALGKSEASVVHVLDSDANRVDETRRRLRSLGQYGPVAAEHWNPPLLPYVDNTVNLLLVETADAVSAAEMNRVLVPGGVAYLKHGDAWSKTVKPPREGVDEWTHYLYDASANPVAHDMIVGPPRHLQWRAGRRHGRSHEYTASTSSVVSTGGRIFYIADLGPIATLREPADWKLIARDGYNGIQLWDRPIGKWLSHLCGWTQGPRQIQRRLVAVDDRVYVTLGYHSPLEALDAATGETVKVYPETEGSEEILCHDGVLLLVVKQVTEARLAEYKKWEKLTAQVESPLHLRDTRGPLLNAFRRHETQAPRTILALKAATGQVLWRKTGDETAGLVPFSLRASGGRVFCHRQGVLHCFDLKTGKTLWAAPSNPLAAVSEDALVVASRNKITLLAPQDGQPRWSRAPTLSNIRDVFIAGGALWLGGGKPYDSGRKKYTGPAWGPYFAVGHDLATGDIIKEITAENPKHHHRCYESKATDRFIIGGRRGTEFLDLESGDYLWHSWARGTCRYGVMPCNGMLYVPPHACGCYITVKLPGFNALAPARGAIAAAAANPAAAGQRLEKGPAYGQVASRPPGSRDWPTYRGDGQRSGRVPSEVPSALKLKWQTEPGDRVTAPVVAGGRLFVARPDRHELLALEATSGRLAWSFTTGGRVDSPPTIHNGRVLLGCRDGYVYSLRADDGTLDWRFRAAATPRRIVANGQVESAAPIHGSVLIHHGTLVFTAGRSSYLDGGLDLYRLDPATGRAISKTRLFSPDEQTGRQPEQFGPAAMPGARSDILSADDEYLYLRDLTFTQQGVEVPDRKPHLFTLTDFLDETGTHRSYWIFGTEPSISTGCSGRNRNLLYGRLLVFDEKAVYGYGRSTVHWSNEFEDGPYRIFARRRDADKAQWSRPLPIHVRAMILAGQTIFAAGDGPVPSKASEKQATATGPTLLAISASDGSELAHQQLPTPALFDGLAAADGELFLTLENGQLLCMSEK